MKISETNERTTKKGGGGGERDGRKKKKEIEEKRVHKFREIGLAATVQFESRVYSRLIAFTYMVNSPWIVTSSRSTARCRV